MPFEQGGRVEIECGRGQHGERQNRDQDLGKMQRQRPAAEAQQQLGRGSWPGSAVDQSAQGPSGQENEQLGGIGKPQIAVGETIENVVGNMIDEDRHQRETAPKIDLIGLPHPTSPAPAIGPAPPVRISEICLMTRLDASSTLSGGDHRYLTDGRALSQRCARRNRICASAGRRQGDDLARPCGVMV